MPEGDFVFALTHVCERPMPRRVLWHCNHHQKAQPMHDKAKRTQAIHGAVKRSQFNELSEAIFMTQGFVYETAEAAEARFIASGPDEYIYARYGNPTVAMFEERMALLEGAEDAFATASGMAAVNAALMCQLEAGDHVVSSRALFGSCLYILEEILPRFGVKVSFVDGTDLGAWENAITNETKLVFFETIANPTLEVIDVQAVSALAHNVGAMVVVDNVFATPVLSRVIDLGVDVVVYSATKHIDGQGRALGGLVLGSQEFIRGTLEPYLKHTGAAMSPFTAWLMLKSVETMALRVNAQCDNAQKVADALKNHPKITALLYPGHSSHPQHDLCARQMSRAGTMVSFEVQGGKEGSFAFLNALEIVLISNNLGDAKSIATPPAWTTHQRLDDAQKDALGITPGLVRFSAGLEDPDDLVRDILDALDKV